MIRTCLAAITAAAVVLALAAAPADARTKKKKVKRAPAQVSLDGRVTGQPRTCGFDYFIYDSRGVPVGPYCH
jgi:hypothetical protein